MAKPETATTAEQWKKAAMEATEAIAVLINIQTETKTKLDEIPEDELGDAKARAYQEVRDLDLNTAYDIVEEARGVIIQ